MHGRHKHTGNTLVLLLTLLFLLFDGTLWAKVYLDIDSPSFHKFPIAVADFKPIKPYAGKEALDSWFAGELARCLDITGYFQVLDKKSFIEDPAKAGITAEGIRFDDWTMIGAEYLVKGGFQMDGREMTTEFRLFDVVNGELVVGKRYVGKPEDKSRMVMRFLNELLAALTGESGNFDTRIAFVKKSGTSKDIYTINFDGSDLRRVTSYNSLTLAPRWSADGRFMAFTCYKDGNPDLYVRDMTSGATRKLASYSGVNVPGAWSANSERLLVSLSRNGNPDIYDMTVKTSVLQRLTRDYSIDVSPARSPDEKSVAFVSNRNGSPQIYIMDADGGNVRLLTHQGGYNTMPAWSPKGGKIAYEGSVGGKFQIFVIDAAGGEPQQLTFDPWDHESSSWSPDGRYLAYSVSGYGRSRIEIMHADGRNRRVLYEDAAGCQGASWSPHIK
jgi:TolB protein